jgi:Bcr/CflA subfamily drug resistance transporter
MNTNALNKNFTLLIIVLLVACLAGISSDIYAPSLPAISANLGASIALVQWSMSIYMLGLSLSQLVYGPLSEGFGRKLAIMAGLLIFLFATGLCYFAPTIEILIFGRLIQGLGAGACAALWRSIFRDVFSGEQLAKYGSYLSVFMVLVVPAAPALGGYLQEYFGWNASFIFLAIYTISCLLLVGILFKETSRHHQKSRLKFSFIFATYGQLMRSSTFMGYSLCVLLSYGAFFSWFAVGPVLLIKNLGYSPVIFGWISFAILCGAMTVGSTLNARLVERFGLHAMLRFGWSLMFSSGLLMFLSYWFMGINAFFIVASVMIFYMGSTFIFANTFAGAFQNFGHIAGYAGALYGALQVAGASAMGAVVAYLPDNNQVPLAFVYMGCSSGAWFVYKKLVKPPKFSR